MSHSRIEQLVLEAWRIWDGWVMTNVGSGILLLSHSASKSNVSNVAWAILSGNGSWKSLTVALRNAAKWRKSYIRLDSNVRLNFLFDWSNSGLDRDLFAIMSTDKPGKRRSSLPIIIIINLLPVKNGKDRIYKRKRKKNTTI